MTQEIFLKTEEEIEIMAEGGKITASVLKKVLKKARPGVRTLELDKYAEKLIEEAGAKASFKMIDGYNFASCLCVNEVVVHGLPSDYRLRKGDVLGVDLGVYYKGFHTDASWTKLVQNAKGEKQNPNLREIKNFLKVGETALKKAVDQARLENRVGHISLAIERAIEEAGYRVVRGLVGHGIGKNLHEDPEVPGFLVGRPGFLVGRIEKTPALKEGMVLAIEVIYNRGGGEVVHKDQNGDRWTMVTKDASLSASYEQTVAVTKRGPRILTDNLFKKRGAEGGLFL